ncbi:hypothetical protein LPC10_01965 [Methylorubrum sp. B1-46]|uniref:hypothetical protein n=1 Tax=Methylorubrum sp. B1-46 TaxID=2897334 RepID=UPI001E4D74D1|nr:hypothetical protein [Methylorubrum sp. B1-46]UGB26407.1 hypothetical protein LPC10_01965 [Methylorubrum sp. B1-46]
MPRERGILDCGVSYERLRKATAEAAYIVEQYGEVYAPIFDRLYAELQKAESEAAPRDRAQRFLDAYTMDGGLKAIR